MLAPLIRIADAARMAANGSLTHQIRLQGRRDEFRELADVFDTMLEQLESHVTEQQRFAANASHELRTPLAISHTLLDVARNDTCGTTANYRTPAHRQRAGDRPHRGPPATQWRRPRQLYPRTCRPLPHRRRSHRNAASPRRTAPDHARRHRREAQTLGSAALILRMVTNLVQNAIVYNLPAGGTVTVHTESQHDASVLRVENTGHRVPPELIPTLTEPFRRGTERIRTDEHAGAGLGLAIVHSIVRAHDGSSTSTPRPPAVSSSRSTSHHAEGIVGGVSLPRLRGRACWAGRRHWHSRSVHRGVHPDGTERPLRHSREFTTVRLIAAITDPGLREAEAKAQRRIRPSLTARPVTTARDQQRTRRDARPPHRRMRSRNTPSSAGVSVAPPKDYPIPAS